MEPIKIDGSFGEGGGQIIRSAVTLSAITGKPVEIENIRRNRKVPGLRPQHMVGIKILSKICQARVEGLYINSTSLRFTPSQALNLQLCEDIGTAGSIPLILQVLIPAVSLMKKSLKISITGGTDVPWSPTSDYTKFVVGEIFSRIGITFSMDVKKRGYYPKGSGLIKTSIEPAFNLNPLSLFERKTRQAKLFCIFANISKKDIEEQVNIALSILEKNGFSCKSIVIEEKALDSGASIVIFSHDSSSVTGADAIYQKTVKNMGEYVARKFIDSSLGVDLNLSDMLVVPLSLIKDTSVYRVKEITKHLETNLFVASKITGCKYGIGKLDDGFEIRIAGISNS